MSNVFGVPYNVHYHIRSTECADVLCTNRKFSKTFYRSSADINFSTTLISRFILILEELLIWCGWQFYMRDIRLIMRQEQIFFLTDLDIDK